MHLSIVDNCKISEINRNGGGEKKRDKGIQKVAILSKNEDF